MQRVDTLIHARWVLPIRPANTVLEHHSIAIHDNRILDILDFDQAQAQYESNNTVHLPEHVVMPGLINAHTHSPMSLFRGLADDLELMDWLNNHVWPAEKNVINEKSMEDGMRLAIAEMLRGGTTCFNEMYFFPNVAANTAISEGMRGCIGHTIMNVPTGFANDEDEYIAKARAAHEARPVSDLMSWSIAPQGAYTNSDSSLQKAKELADEFDMIMNMHVQETQVEIQINLDQHGNRPIERLHKLGLIDDRFVGVHMVHANDEDIALFAEKGAHVAHCPESNLKLASGFAPIVKMRKAGINVAIGTDGACSNNDLDMFSELRTASFIAKAVNQDATALPAFDVLEMATLGGAKAIARDHDIGTLEKGKCADVIAVDLSSYLTQPVYNPLSHLAYAVNRLQVSHVWVNGRLLLDEGAFTQLDIERTVAQAKVWAEKCAPYSSAGLPAKAGV